MAAKIKSHNSKMANKYFFIKTKKKKAIKTKKHTQRSQETLPSTEQRQDPFFE